MPSPTAAATASPAVCGLDLTLRKAHSGLACPGNEMTYTIQWVNPCEQDVPNVVIRDELPGGIELIGAWSEDGVVTTEGNAVVIEVGTVAKGPGGTATISTMIADNAQPGSLVQNQVSLWDGLGRSVTATDTCRIREQCADEKVFSCFVRGQKHTRPGSQVTYVVRYKNGGDLNALTATLPAEIEVLGTYPPASGSENRVNSWQGLANTSGKVKVLGRVKGDVPNGSLLRVRATVADGKGREAHCDQTTDIQVRDRLALALRSQGKAEPNGVMTYVVRYKHSGYDEAVVQLAIPPQLTVLGTCPPTASADNNVLTWTGLSGPAGMVKAFVRLSDKCVPGCSLDANATVICDEGTVQAKQETVIRPYEHQPTTRVASCTLSVQTSTKPGAAVTYLVRYQNVPQGVTLDLDLPDGLSVNTVQPPPRAVEGGVLVWEGIPSPSGSVKVNASVAGNAASGTMLCASAALVDGGGKVLGSCDCQTKVTAETDTGTVSGPSSLSLEVPSTVRRGLSTDIRLWYSVAGDGAAIDLVLPPELAAELTVPAASVGTGGQVRWPELPGPSGSVKARVIVSPSTPPGTVLSVDARLTGPTGDTRVTSAELAVRE
jgi:uncharacterized repeat protein (TIGR01451 family)